MSPLKLDEFWEYYADQELLDFKRDPATSAYSGTCRNTGTGSGPMAEEEISFAFDRAALLRYGYERDRMFGLGIFDELSEALAMLVAMPLMKEESIPNRDQLELVFQLLGLTPPEWDVEYSAVHAQALAELGRAKISREKAVALMDELKPDGDDYEAYEGTGMVALLHAERELLLKAYAFCTTDSQITRQIAAVIENHEREDTMTVQAAIWALGRHDDKAAIDSLIALLNRGDFQFHCATIQETLQFLCSGRELIPIADEQEWKHWSDRKQQLPTSPAAWTQHDATSVFWEKRLRVARQWSADRAEGQLAQLKMDEVLPVRLAAGGPEQLDA
ncbi:MAG: hypothetical protein PVJ57_07470 [Phycisphaerae bacterium]|jgi:hypothetical protein